MRALPAGARMLRTTPARLGMLTTNMPAGGTAVVNPDKFFTGETLVEHQDRVTACVTTTTASAPTTTPSSVSRIATACTGAGWSGWGAPQKDALGASLASPSPAPPWHHVARQWPHTVFVAPMSS